MKMKQIVSKYETLINIINYVLCDLYACKNLMIKSLFFKIKDFYLRRRFKVKYLSKHYISDMERKYDMEFFVYIFYTIQFFIVVTLFKFAFYKKKSKYSFKIFDRIRSKNIFRWRCITLYIIAIDLILLFYMLSK